KISSYNFLDLSGSISNGIISTYYGANGYSCNIINGDLIFLQRLQYPNMGEATGSATAQHQSYFLCFDWKKQKNKGQNANICNAFQAKNNFKYKNKVYLLLIFAFFACFRAGFITKRLWANSAG